MQLTGPLASHAVLAHEAIDPRDPEAAKADMGSRRFRKVSLLLMERFRFSFESADEVSFVT